MKFTNTNFVNNTQYKTDEELLDKICTDFNQFKGKFLGKGSYGSAYELKGFENFFRNGENIVVKEIVSRVRSSCRENKKITTPSGYKYSDIFYCEGDNQVLAEYYISLAASMLNSENFIGTYVYKDCNNSNKQYIFMEKIDTTFRKFMENPNRDQRVFDAVVVQILHALWCLHKGGINHNDSKADNIFILEAKDYKNRDGFNLSDFDYVRYDFGDDDNVIYIPVKDMKFIVKIGDYGLSQKYSEPAVLTDFVYENFLVDKLAPLYDIMLAFSENGQYMSPLYKTIQTYLVGFGESINLVTGKIDHKKAKEKWRGIKCICDDTCNMVNKLDKIIMNEDDDSLKKRFNDHYKYIDSIRCIYYNYKDQEKDRRQIYNFLLSNMKTSNLDVTKIIKTGFFREQMEMYGWYTPDSNSILPFGGPGEYGGYANDSVDLLTKSFADMNISSSDMDFSDSD